MKNFVLQFFAFFLTSTLILVSFNSSAQLPCQLKASFNFFPDKANPTTVKFSSSSPGKITNYSWDFGDGTVGKDSTTIHLFRAPGVYKVTLTIGDINIKGCVSSYTMEVPVGTPPCQLTPEFSVTEDPKQGTVAFNDLSTGKISRWYWDFGNGMYSEKPSPIITLKPGYYNVCLTLYDDINQCKQQKCKQISIGSQTGICQAKFDYLADPTSTKVSFTDASSGNLDSWYWDFGDGNYSYEQNPVYAYARPGIYNVCLKVSDKVSQCFNSYCIQVTVGSAPNCTAKFNKEVRDLTVAFTDASYGEPTEWYWDFGDGNFSYEQNPTYTYSKPGFYTVSLTTSNGVCKNNYRESIQAGSAICQSKFSFYIDQPTKTVSFKDESYGQISDWYWDFGNGDFSTVQAPVYTYKLNGSYRVTLQTYDKLNNCKSAVTNIIQVGQANCVANFVYKPIEGTNTISFADNSTGNIAVWYWDFGDGATSGTQNADHNYSKPGYYTVSLTIYNRLTMCKNSYSETIKVGSQTDCKTAFSTFQDPVTQQVYYKDESYGNPDYWYWEFGDGQFSTLQEPSNIFKTEGIYTSCLTTYSRTTGCKSNYCSDIKVGSGGEDCQASFENFASSDTIYFNNTSLGDISDYYWDFGDGTYSTYESPYHKYLKNGYFNVCLTIFNKATRCYNTSCKIVSMGNAWITDCKAKFSYVADTSNKTVYFKDESLGNPLSWLWTMDDGTTYTTQYPSHVFETKGSHKASLLIRTGNGCRSVNSLVVGLGVENLVADYIYEIDTTVVFNKTQAQYPVSFYGTAYGKPSKWKWAFGDGSYDSLHVNVVHTYYNAGTYNACLTISDPVTNISSIKCQSVKVGDIATGIKEDLMISEVAIYPNPVISSTSIAVSYNLKKSNETEISLYDIKGQRISSLYKGMDNEGLNNRKLTLETLPEGLYLINIRSGNVSIRKPVLFVK